MRNDNESESRRSATRAKSGGGFIRYRIMFAALSTDSPLKLLMGCRTRELTRAEAEKLGAAIRSLIVNA